MEESDEEKGSDDRELVETQGIAENDYFLQIMKDIECGNFRKVKELA